MKWKWNESGFRPPLCTYRLNWARRTSWGWWDDWDDTVLQTQDSKFEPWRSEAEYATSRSRRLPTILTFTRGWGRNNFVSFKPPRPGTEPRTLAWKAAVLTTTLGPPPEWHVEVWRMRGQADPWWVNVMGHLTQLESCSFETWMWTNPRPPPCGRVALTLPSLNLPLSSSTTTSRELLSQFSTCSGWRWLDVGEKVKKKLPCIGKPVSWKFSF